MTEEILETQEDSEIKTESQDLEQEEKRPVLKLPKKNTIEIEGKDYPKEVVEKAIKDGWSNRETLKARGKEEIYVDPQTFNEKGQTIVPILRDKVEKRDEEIALLKKMLQKKIANDVKDKLENIESQLRLAKEEGQIENVESLVEKRNQLKSELEEHTKEEKLVPPPIAPRLPIEIIDWEDKNRWIYDNQNPYNARKKQKANDLFSNIQTNNPHLNLREQLDLLDVRLQEFEEGIRQKLNTNPPIQAQSTSAIIPSNSRTFDNLTSHMKKIFIETCVDSNGEAFKGNALEIAKKTFLDNCTEEHFKK